MQNLSIKSESAKAEKQIGVDSFESIQKKMQIYNNSIIFVTATVILVYSEAEVMVTIVGKGAKNDDLLCNQTATVMCRIWPYGGTMTLKVDEEYLADCVYTQCTTGSQTSVNHAFAFDTDQGIFNITMPQVSYSVNGKTFKCDDGFTAAYITPLVKVLPTSSTLHMVSSKNAADTSIKVTTGCIHPSSSVTFTWFYFKNGNTPTLYTGERFISTDEIHCTSGPCGGPGVVKATSTVIIQENPTGESYYFQALVQHPDTQDIIVTSGRTFKLKGDSEVFDSTDHNVGETNEGLRVFSEVQTLFAIIVALLLKDQ